MSSSLKNSNSYVLEHANEFDRLERQSTLPAYDYRKELSGLTVKDGMKVLDAGCGSGIVTRYLASLNRNASVVGIDAAAKRLEQTRTASLNAKNIEFIASDLCKIPFADSSFDIIVCRYVLQHTSRQSPEILSELYRCLKPGGKLYIVDVDGMFVNLNPLSGRLAEWLTLLEKRSPVDMRLGRKLKSWLQAAKFQTIDIRIEAQYFEGETLKAEIQLTRERLIQSTQLLIRIFGDEITARRFIEAYLAAMADPGSCYFFNRFIATATR